MENRDPVPATESTAPLLFGSAREIQRVTGLSRWAAYRAAVHGELPFRRGDNGLPQFSILHAMRIQSAQVRSIRTRIAQRARAERASRRRAEAER